MSRIGRVILFFLSLCCRIELPAQLCTGSLGDPVVNIDFGSAANPGGQYAPPGAYTFVASSCPNDGFYTLTGASNSCFGGSWHTVVADHTGNGYFMLVNASYQPGDFFRSTVTNLCPNTTYEFAAWVLNVMRANGIQPDLTFSIEREDGTLLAQYATGPVAEHPSPLWEQFGFFFTTPPDNPVIVLRITNNAPGGIGNDLAIDDITFRPCGPKVSAQIQGIPGEVNICEYDQADLLFTADPSAWYLQPSVQWQLSRDSGMNWSNLAGGIHYLRKPTGPGQYWYRFSVAETGAPAVCRINSNILVCNIWPKPLADAGPDRVMLSGESIQMKGMTEPGAAYSWDPPWYLSDPGKLDPVAFPPNRTQYRLQVQSASGCMNEDWMTVEVAGDIYVPSAFTPNADGLNDTWRIPLMDPDWGLMVKIYDRYGQMVYAGEGLSIQWDGTFRGTLLSSGTYVYILTTRTPQRQRKGTITLIR